MTNRQKNGQLRAEFYIPKTYYFYIRGLPFDFEGGGGGGGGGLGRFALIEIFILFSGLNYLFFT